jgi:hypothetical protein
MKSISDILWLIFSISAAIATAHIIIERLFGSPLFSTFLLVMPGFARALFPFEHAILWFEHRSLNNKIDQAWDLCLIYFFMLLLVLAFIEGLWISIILQLLSVWHLPFLLLVLWFALLFFSNFVSASIQTAIKIKMIPPPIKTINGIKKRMFKNPALTLKLFFSFFFQNWIMPGFNTLKLLFTVSLVIILYWPAWVIRRLQKNNKLDLSNKDERNYYFAGYTLFCVLAAILLKFLPV